MSRARKQPKIDYQLEIARLCKRANIGARHYGGRWHPFCWNTKNIKVPTFDAVFEAMAKDHFPGGRNDAILSIPSIPALKEQWESHAEKHFEEALQNMRDTMTEANGRGGCTYNFITPEREKKYGVTPPPDRGWGVKISFQGRSDGWLSLEMFEGIRFKTVAFDQEYKYMDIDDDERQTYRRKLCAFLDEISEAVARRHEEMLYQLGFRMYTLVEPM